MDGLNKDDFSDAGFRISESLTSQSYVLKTSAPSLKNTQGDLVVSLFYYLHQSQNFLAFTLVFLDFIKVFFF